MGCIGIMENDMETSVQVLGSQRGYIGKVEKNMETE